MFANEKEIEQELIRYLQDLKYTYRPDINDRESLEKNFKQKFDELNSVTLSEHEFKRLLEQIITPDVYMASRNLRETQYFERDDGTPLHYTLVNTNHWCKNSFEIINQLRMNTDYSHHRYDVIILMNGVPVVQIELKTLMVSPKKAMHQIVEYKNDVGNGYAKTLMCFLQLFIVSNQNDTWYFANNNKEHFRFDEDERFLSVYQFADKDNKKITYLDAFAKEFLAKCTLAETISRYMVLLETEKKLLMMRPYQVYAVKAIVDCIEQNCGNGYIWHTTGSGKTLTSFKASTLLKDNHSISKCLFVVDRKDLDRQTRDEFNKFQAGCVEENSNTETLVQRLLSDDGKDKVIVTTIQKLGRALSSSEKTNYKERLSSMKNKRIVFIFDECHRSQFGENHKAIKDFFPNAQLFGFTGTPIFDENATTQKKSAEGNASNLTTENVFQKCLHTYTITNAIEDRNVLRFKVDYYKPEGEEIAPEFIEKKAIVEAILKKHDSATAQRKFNALFATSSINDAIEYYHLFKTIQSQKKSESLDFEPLNVACVFSPPAGVSPDMKQYQEDLEQEREDNKIEPDKKKKALIAIMQDYNTQYGGNHSIYEFDTYYQDVQKRIKDQQYPKSDLPHKDKIDITIVVDMLLTGFDSKFLNTLYVHKNLKHHGLIQAFSRTNRVLNDTKPNGIIVDFKHQQEQVQDAIKMFSGEGDTEKAGAIWLVETAPVVIQNLEASYQKLEAFMRSKGLACTPSEVPNLKGDHARAEFVTLFKEVQRIKTQLDQYTDLSPEQIEQVETILPQKQQLGFKGIYLDVANKLKALQEKPEKETDEKLLPEVEQLDFEFVLFASELIDYDYIMKLISNYSRLTGAKREMGRDELIRLIASDAKFIDEQDEIRAFVDSLEIGVQIKDEQDVKEQYEAFKNRKHNNELSTLAQAYSIDPKALQTFVSVMLRRMIFDDELLTELFAPLGLGWKERNQRKTAFMVELKPLLQKRTKDREISGLKVYD